MKTVFRFACIVLGIVAAFAAKPKKEPNTAATAPAPPAKVPVAAAPATVMAYGAGVAADKQAMPFAKLLSESADQNGKTVVVEGTVASVCKNKGCWMTLQHEGKEMRVRFKDYAFFVPKDCEGKTARVEGVFAIEMVSVADARHYLEDEGKLEEAKKITEPVESYTFMASGVTLR